MTDGEERYSRANPVGLEEGEGARVPIPGEEEGAGELPYPTLAPVVLFRLTQTSRPRCWCLLAVCHPYPLPGTLVLVLVSVTVCVSECDIENPCKTSTTHAVFHSREFMAIGEAERELRVWYTYGREEKNID